jgi:hypothetical protein
MAITARVISSGLITVKKTRKKDSGYDSENYMRVKDNSNRIIGVIAGETMVGRWAREGLLQSDA